MNLSDNARKQVEREGDTSGFGPYGYVYDVSAPIKWPAVQLSNAGGEIHILRNTGIYSFSVINDSNVDTHITDFIFTLQTQWVHFEKFESIIAEGLNFTEEINTFVCSPAAVSDTTTEIRCTAKDPKWWNIGQKWWIKNFFGINPYVKSVEIEWSQSTLLLKDIYFTQKNMVWVLKGFIPVWNWSVPFTATKRLPNGWWMTDEWSSCVNNEKARMVWCQSDGVEVEDMYCTYTKPMSSQSCSVTD